MKKLSVLWFIVLFILLIIVAGFEYTAYHVSSNSSSKNEVTVAPLPTFSPDQFQAKFFSNDVDGAIAIAQEGIATSSKDTVSLLHLAMAYEQKGSLESRATSSVKAQQSILKVNADKAVEAVKKVLAIDPTNSEAYRVIGYAYEMLGQYKNAANAYTASLIYFPQSAVTYVQRGHLAYTQGQTQNAYADYKAAYDINPKNTLLNLDLAQYFYEKNDVTKALPFAAFAVASSPDLALSSAAAQFLAATDTSSSSLKALSPLTNITVEDSHSNADDGWCVVKTGARCEHIVPKLPAAPTTQLSCKAPTVKRFGTCIEVCPDGTMKDANLNPTCSLSAVTCPDAAHVFPATYNQPLPEGSVRAVGPYAKCTVAKSTLCPTSEVGQSCSTSACPGQNDGTLMCSTTGLSCQAKKGFVCNGLIKTFTVTPTTAVRKNQTCLLRWNADKAQTCTIVDENSKVFIPPTTVLKGAASTTPITKSKKYTLTCSDKSGRSVSQTRSCNLQ